MIALYARVSTTDQDARMQLDALRLAATARGWTEVTEYVDTGSGAKEHLPERDRMIADARSGNVTAVVCWRFDRLSRSTRQLVTALENFRTWNVDFISLQEGIDTTTPAGRMCFTMIAAIAEFERETIRERVRAGMDKARTHGTRSGRAVGRPAADVPVDQVKEMRAHGYSWRQIAEALGIPHSTIRSAVTREEK